ncbi:MAG: hypothetical protein EOR68_10420 [Mesorhizobium sp.]|uniref:DUF6894 family protein n=1 Tax=Mesorhizobium sp. TaxID=1871066 RepID=UPI000FE925D7|nr:hypothetical protein [Mesorhizobium sp.]RWL84116.1 MAG: hypothetical protein EOR69_07685 [Mesorhizobium sp.]RWL88595.1 MAG: hypothetical protein EOR67_11525 [Mesorhizobium sp.]RWM00812.1 MAG: hypothetical protein EOR68_10420 [Mesorhizobium sp.]RWM03531.1 MAG: hypothetical protein EOR70_04305 [Mesorhizobium sp.]
MPHYFFDIDANGGHTHDEVGLPFSSKIHFRKAAVATLPALALQDRSAKGGNRNYSISVRDERGQVVYTATLTFDDAFHH